MKLTNNYKKLFQIMIFLLGLLCAILCLGKLLQVEKDPQIVSARGRLDSYTEELDEKDRAIFLLEERVSSLEQTLDWLTKSFQELKTQYDAIVENAKHEAVNAIAERDLYINYAYTIASYYYPDVDPEYVCAIVFHESRFDPLAQNKDTDARGLTQIRPKWHAERAKNLGVTNLYDPYGNLLVCFDILSDGTDRYGFDYTLNLFAGGYPYANQYKNSKSPFIKQLDEIIQNEDFSASVLSSGVYDLIGGEVSAAS